MRVLQSLGTTDGIGPKPFRYGRRSHGSLIVSTLGQSNGWNTPITIDGHDWNILVDRIFRNTDTVFGVTGPAGGYFIGETIELIISELTQINLHGIDPGYVAAILVHEGVLNHHHGQLKRDRFNENCTYPFEARIFLKPSSRDGSST